MKIKKIVALLFVLITITTVLTGCGKEPTTYSAVSGFYYSGDKGHTYGDGTKEYVIGETVYMKIKFRVASNESKTSQVKVTLTIPNVQNVDAKYMDGQVITPNYDAVRNVTTYEFTANASKDALESECVFQFIPNAVGSITMTLIYDDMVRRFGTRTTPTAESCGAVTRNTETAKNVPHLPSRRMKSKGCSYRHSTK